MEINSDKAVVVGQVNMVEGKKQYLFDDKGRRYVDAFGGIATVCCGHCHPDVVEAIVKQTTKLQHSTVLYLNHNIADFAQALASKLPGDLKVTTLSFPHSFCFFLFFFINFFLFLMGLGNFEIMTWISTV